MKKQRYRTKGSHVQVVACCLTACFIFFSYNKFIGNDTHKPRHAYAKQYFAHADGKTPREKGIVRNVETPREKGRVHTFEAHEQKGSVDNVKDPPKKGIGHTVKAYEEKGIVDSVKEPKEKGVVHTVKAHEEKDIVDNVKESKTNIVQNVKALKEIVIGSNDSPFSTTDAPKEVKLSIKAESQNMTSQSTAKPQSWSERATDIAKTIQVFAPDVNIPTSSDWFFKPRDINYTDLDVGWLVKPSPCPRQSVTLLVVVPSVLEDAHRRAVIRSTWASLAYRKDLSVAKKSQRSNDSNVSGDDINVATTGDDVSVKRVSNDDSLKRVSNDDSLKTVSNDDGVKTVSNDDSLKTVSNDDIVKTVSNDDSLKTVSNDDSLKTVSNDDSVKPVSKDDSVKTVSNDDNVKTVSKDVTVKVIFFLGITPELEPLKSMQGRWTSRERGEQPGLSAEALKLADEWRRFGDIAVGDFRESYLHLSLKIALALRWVKENCAKAQHVLKVDQDTIVNLSLLLEVLQLLNKGSSTRSLPLGADSSYVLGHRHRDEAPEVMRVGKWRVRKDLYPMTFYPKYAYGNSYVISGDAVQKLVSAALRMPLVPNEDAYITGILAKTANVTRLNLSPPEIKSHFPHAKHCRLAQGRDIWQTKVRTDDQMQSLWTAIQTGSC